MESRCSPFAPNEDTWPDGNCASGDTADTRLSRAALGMSVAAELGMVPVVSLPKVDWPGVAPGNTNAPHSGET